MINAFYLALKPLFVLQILKFFFKFYGMQKNGFTRKIKLISKFITLQPGKQKSKGNKIIDQVIEYNMRNICLGKLYTKWGEETILRAFSK